MWVDGEEWLSVADVVARLPVKAATVWGRGVVLAVVGECGCLYWMLWSVRVGFMRGC